MADDRYGGYGRGEDWRRREDSIFSDDDRPRQARQRERGWSDSPGEYDRERGGRDEDRGFFDRAGDEVRSWFGDEEAEQRRERDVRRDEARDAFAGRDYDRRYEGGRSRYGGTPDYERSGGYGAGASFAPEQAGYGQSMSGRREHGERSSFGRGRSHWDDNYRRWRERQMERFDREYDDYCRERQQQFEQDFDSWRSSRLTEGGVGGASAPRGDAGGRERTSRGTGSQGAGATTTGGTAAASRSSTGSKSGETENAVGAGGETGTSRGRGGRSRS